jgi:hypothetical protein
VQCAGLCPAIYRAAPTGFVQGPARAGTYTFGVRKFPIIAVAGIALLVVVALFLQLGFTRLITGNVDSVRLPEGIRMCVPDPKARPGQVLLAIHNDSAGSVVLLDGTAAVANGEHVHVWLLPKNYGDGDYSGNAVGAGLGSLSGQAGWRSRKTLPTMLAAHSRGTIGLTVEFPSGVASGAKVVWVDVRYIGSDGQIHVARSDVSTSFVPNC